MRQAKTIISAAQLEELLIAELRGQGFQQVRSIGIYNVVEPGERNWSIGTCNFGGEDIALCTEALRKIETGYASQYSIEERKLW